MQLPEPPPPLAPLWDRITRARALPPDLDVQLLYVAIKDRLAHPEWEVRLHALRVLADLLPLSGNALSFPFDQVVDNLGHSSPNVRKAALDALKVFCNHCEEPECAVAAILDKCFYNNIRPHSPDRDTKLNIITGLILSIPSVMAILKRRSSQLDMYPIFKVLGEKLFDNVHRDVALRCLMKMRRICGPRDYMMHFSRLDSKIQEKFRVLCDNYDEDSLDVYYAPRRSHYRNKDQPLVQINHVYNNSVTTPLRMSTDTSSEDSYGVPVYTSNQFAKVIIETEIKFDSDTAITMTVLEHNETESDKNTSEDDYDSYDRHVLKFSEVESEDSDVIVKKVRFGGESVKIRTPDSDNMLASEDDNRDVPAILNEPAQIGNAPGLVRKIEEIKRDAIERERAKPQKKSGIPLPIIHNKSRKYNAKEKLKSKSLSELYDYFNKKNDLLEDKGRERTGFALTISEVRSPEKIPSPVEPHREVEVLHNLQRSPTVSPRRQKTRVTLNGDGLVLSLVTPSLLQESELLSPRPPTPLRTHYQWENLGIVPRHIADQLHNTENWISAVKAADHLHSTLLQPENVNRVEPEALSLVEHMWALSDAVPATRAPAEGAVCAVIRSGSGACVRRLLPALLTRAARDPAPAALPHALLQRMALHHVIDLVFDPDMVGVSNEERAQSAQLRATLCLARAAGPAAVLAAVRRRLAGSPRADIFCYKLRERLHRPIQNNNQTHVARMSQLPVAARRRARSTPPAPPAPRPARLRPLPDSAPLLGIMTGKEFPLKPLSPISFNVRDSSVPDSAEEAEKPIDDEKKTIESFVAETSEVVDGGEREQASRPQSAASLGVEDLTEKSNTSRRSATSDNRASLDGSVAETVVIDDEQQDERAEIERGDPGDESFENSRPPSEKSRPPSERSRPASEKSALSIPSNESSSRSLASNARSENRSPEPTGETRDQLPSTDERDVRNALAECVAPARHEDWEVIVNGLTETERLAADAGARAPAAAWRLAARAAAAHVRSLRSRVARAACSALGALFEHRGRALDPELEEAAGALLERCADVNRFLRADAAAALGRVACGGGCARAGAALARRGAGHRAGPVRAAAAQALARLVREAGAARVLELPGEPRALVLRAAGELLGDAHAETRLHARHLCLALAEDVRFRQLLKDAMPPSRYRAIEKFVDKLRCR